VNELIDLVELGRAQFGLISRTQAKERGYSREKIRWKLSTGEWERFRCGVYRFRAAPATWSQLAMAALLQAGEGAALSHQTAAFLHDLDGFKKERPRLLHLTAPIGRGLKTQSVRFHRTREASLPTEVVRGLRVTSLARTLVDLARVLKPGPLEVALDAARRIRPGFPEELEAYLATLRARHGRLITLKALVKERESALDSAQEVELLQEVLKRGLPKPTAGFSVFHLNKFVAKLDLAWVEQKVGLHFDSYLHHQSRQNFDKDAKQRAQLVAAGWTTIVVTRRTRDGHEWSDALKLLLKSSPAQR
jgi:hypothetical protein